MCTYLKNMEGYKLKDLKLKEFDSIQDMFDRAFKRVNTFEDFRTELVEGNEKRAGTELVQESIKKQKVEYDKETTELKQRMEIIPDEKEVEIDDIPLAVKSPSIVGWKIYKEGRKIYYQIMRADEKSQTLVEDLDLILWGDLKTVFKPHIEDKIYMLVENKYPLTPSTLVMMLEKKLMFDYERISFRFYPFQFSYPPRKLIMEEMLYKFINKGRREHAKMGAFIREFKTTNELLLKERNNSLSELEFEVYGLSKAINDAQSSNYEVKEPNEVLVETKPQETKEQTIQPSTPSIPFPHRLKKENEEAQQWKFLENLKQLHINMPFTEALFQMPKHAKFLKGILSNKTRLEEACTVTMNKRCSTVLLNKLLSKEKDLGSFTIPCDIGHLHINNALADLGASISLMPYTMYETLGLREPKPMKMSLELADRSIKYPRGIAENVLIKIDKFILPIDFVILDMREDSKILIILGRPFLATARAMINVFNKKITLRVGNEEVISNVDQLTKRPPTEDDECHGIDFLDTTIHLKTQELLENDQLDSFLVNNLEESVDLSELESFDKTDETRTPIRRIGEVNTPYS
ncbi:DNA-directed DNA polymerase [Tanacetum coccineum]|uniref:DNA-directed DNA polymerase n=1 Tax=Tanacetum coccineum TaxID=301880 RepID=A0ABQ5CUQ9_9ASTR